MKIVKRSGQEVIFDLSKITIAISKANNFGELTADQIKNISDTIEKAAAKLDRTLTVEEIQDMVEIEIMKKKAYRTAKSYIEYRYVRSLARRSNTTDDHILTLIEANNEEAMQENSNKNPTINATQRDYMAGEVSKDITKRILLPHRIVNAHNDGIIHFHDMDYYAQHMHNCDLVNAEDMLNNGTVITETLIEKPHTFYTACNVTTQFIAQISSNQYGGQSVSLKHLAPFVEESRKKIRKKVEEEYMCTHRCDCIDEADRDVIEKSVERRVRDEIRDGVQTIQYQVTTIMTTNGQAPFITMYLYLGEAETEQERKDLALIIEEVLLQRIQGTKNKVGVYVSPAFPKLIYVLEELNIDPESPYYYLTELAAKCTAKRLVPDYISEKILLELKFPKDKLLTIKQRRDIWGDENIWGTNPFKNMSDSECDTLQSYIENKMPSTMISDLPQDAQDICYKHNIRKKDILPMVYTCMGCLDYQEKIETDSCTCEIGELVEGINFLEKNVSLIERFKASANEEINI